MLRISNWITGLAIVMLACAAAAGQQPTGSISGVVADATGRVIPGAVVQITNAETGFSRTLTSNAVGVYAVPSLAAGHYTVEADARGFKKLQRGADVAAGVTTTADLSLQVGASTDTVVVNSASDQIDYETHGISGTVEPDVINALPLNGRNFLQLAELQPGVSVSTTSTAIHNQQFAVSVQGGNSDFTRVTVDGINIDDLVDGGTMQNFSQEIVQEFQIATTNFDISAGASASGAINVVTKTGSNQFHGVGYLYYRDNNMAAYPLLTYNPQNPNPFFVRRQSGGSFSGPILKDRLFFFFNIELTNQTGESDIQPIGQLASFATIHPSPYYETEMSNRFDYKINDKNTLFLRYSHDNNNGFGVRNGSNNEEPSDWTSNRNWADQTVAGLTTTFKSNLVNEAHLAYTFWTTKNAAADAAECASCIGFGGPSIDVDADNMTIGNEEDAPQNVMERHYIWNDTLTWQKGRHQVRVGGEIDHQHVTGYYAFDDPAQVDLWSPEQVADYNAGVPASKRISVPSTYTTLSDILQLPLMDFTIGIGSPLQPAPFDRGEGESNTHYNWFATDTWRATSSLNLTYGLGWTFDNNLMNFDLPKPQYLSPILGTLGIGYPKNFRSNLSPSVGFAWSPDRKRQTVIRGGFGLYYDSAILSDKLEERAYLGPVGNGRYPLPGTLVPNTLPGVAGVPVGTALNFPTLPSAFTAGDFENILSVATEELTEELGEFSNPTSLTYTGINLFKEAGDLYPNNFRPPESQHFNLGAERRLSPNWVLSVNAVWKHNIYTNMGNVDLNHYNSASGPVIPACTSEAQELSLIAECSEDSIEFLLPDGRSRYSSITVGADRRMSHNLQVTAYYTYQNEAGFNGVFNLNNLFSSWGQELPHHVFTVNGIYLLPWGFHVSLISTMQSAAPFTASLSGIDLSGTGTGQSLLPGAPYGAFGTSMGKADLVRLVNSFNQIYAGTVDALKQTIPTLTLPSHYSFGQGRVDQDVRLGKKFAYRGLALDVFGECFNCLNVSNLQGYSGDLLVPSSFGQPTSRLTQVFGSGGPRAIQLGARLSF